MRLAASGLPSSTPTTRAVPSSWNACAAAARTGADVATCGHHPSGGWLHLTARRTPLGTYTGRDIAISSCRTTSRVSRPIRFSAPRSFSSVRFATDIHRAEDALAVFQCLMRAKAPR